MRSALAAVLTTCALALVGCEKKTSAPPPPSAPSGGTAAAPASGGTPGVTGDTILIGEVGSLTGSEATFGISTRNGIELAIKEANAAGGVKGKKIDVRVYDDQSKPEEAANAATRLINQDNVLAHPGRGGLAPTRIAMAHQGAGGQGADDHPVLHQPQGDARWATTSSASASSTRSRAT